MLSRWGRALATIALFAVILGAAIAQSNEPAASPNPPLTLISSGWTVKCQTTENSADLACEASQMVSLENARQSLLTVFVSPLLQADKTKAFVLRLKLPHGLNLPAGINIAIDGNRIQSPIIQTSNQAGVFARTELTAPLQTLLKAAKVMTVEFATINGKTLTVPISLRGYSAVYRKLK